jgi:hypothetical protein
METEMRTWFWSAVALAVAAVAPGSVAAQPAKAVEPTVEVRIRSVDDLLGKAGYIGGLFDQENAAAQAGDVIKLFIEGIDTARPIGAYGILDAEVTASPVVVMLPISDQAKFLQTLKTRLDVTPEDAGKGVKKAFVPKLNEIYFTFADDYLFAARDPRHLDAKMRVNPKTYFANPDGSVASVVARLDRVPADMRTFVTGQLEHQVKERQKQNEGGKKPGELKLEALAIDGLVGSAKTVADEGKELAVRLFIDEKADEISAEVSLTAKPGTGLTKTITGLKGRTSLPAGIAKATDPVIAATGKLALPDDLRKQLDPVINTVFEELAANAGDRAVAERVLEALAPTAKAGAADVAVSLTGPDAKGKHVLVAAVAVKGGKEMEKLAKEFAPFAPAEEVTFTFDMEKIGPFSVHKAELGKTEPGFERTFGTKTVWLAISDDVIAVSIESSGAALKAGLKAAPTTVPVIGGKVALARAVPLFDNNLKADEAKALVRDAFGEKGPAGRDTIAFTVDGGDRLAARLVVKGGALKLVVSVNQYNMK